MDFFKGKERKKRAKEGWSVEKDGGGVSSRNESSKSGSSPESKYP